MPEDDEREADHIFILRHTLMNPWLFAGPGGRSYIDAYWSYLESVIDEALHMATCLAGRGGSRAGYGPLTTQHEFPAGSHDLALTQR